MMNQSIGDVMDNSWNSSTNSSLGSSLDSNWNSSLDSTTPDFDHCPDYDRSGEVLVSVL